MKETKIVCNMCGKGIHTGEHGYFDNYLSVQKTWGYGTAFDGETHAFELCEECYRKLIEGFKLGLK